MNLFWARGFEHTSMQDLLGAMDLSKSSLYQAFGGKQQLFRRCVGLYADRFVAQLRQGLAAAPSGRGFIEAFLYSVLDDVDGDQPPRGCLVMNTASEFAQNEPEIARDVMQSIDRFRGVLQAAVERAQREGSIAHSGPLPGQQHERIEDPGQGRSRRGHPQGHYLGGAAGAGLIFLAYSGTTGTYT